MKTPAVLTGSLEASGWVMLWQATPVEPWLTLIVCVLTIGYRVWRDMREEERKNRKD